jgi:hypothetical protein
MTAARIGIESIIPGAQGRIIGALLRIDAPRTISEVARLADVSRDRAATIVTELERIGLVDRLPAGRAHLVSLIEESPVTESLRAIDNARERSIDKLRRAAQAIDPPPVFMALFGSWAREEANDDSDLDVAVIADIDGDRDALLAGLDRWSTFAHRVTRRVPSVVIADLPANARGGLWNAIRRDAVVLVDDHGGDHGT